MKPFLLLLILTCSQGLAQPLPDRQDISYGPHERHKLDVWQPQIQPATPLVIFIHGGGWRGGDKRDIPAGLLANLLKGGYRWHR